MKLVTVANLIVLLFLSACAPENEYQEIQNKRGSSSGGELRCSGFGGIEEKVCPTSFYNLIANQEDFDERIIAIKGVVRTIDGNHYFFPNDISATNREMASGVLCSLGDNVRNMRGSSDLPEGVFITLIGRFSSAPIVTSDLFPPVGKMEVLVIR